MLLNDKPSVRQALYFIVLAILSVFGAKIVAETGVSLETLRGLTEVLLGAGASVLALGNVKR